MTWHRPRFRLIHLGLLIAILAVEFGVLPASISPAVAALTVVVASLAAVSDPFTRTEWAVIVVIFLILIALLAPAVKHSGHGRARPGPAATSGP